jgi:hypothetical protein
MPAAKQSDSLGGGVALEITCQLATAGKNTECSTR